MNYSKVPHCNESTHNAANSIEAWPHHRLLDLITRGQYLIATVAHACNSLQLLISLHRLIALLNWRSFPPSPSPPLMRLTVVNHHRRLYSRTNNHRHFDTRHCGYTRTSRCRRDHAAFIWKIRWHFMLQNYQARFPMVLYNVINMPFILDCGMTLRRSIVKNQARKVRIRRQVSGAFVRRFRNAGPVYYCYDLSLLNYILYRE